MKCTVCGKRFVPTAERAYQAQENVGALSAFTNIYHMYDVIDCPQCGCQHALKVRMPKVNSSLGVEDE